MGNKHTIEFNGTRYDALTGRPLGAASVTAGGKGRPIDDFIQAKPILTAKTAKPAAKTTQPKPATLAIKRTNKQHQAHQPARATTLMRSAVKKPEPSKRPHKVQVPAGSARTWRIVTEPIADRTAISERHLAHAKLTNRSPIISRFRQGVSEPIHRHPQPARRSAPPSQVAPAKPPTKSVAAIGDQLDELLASGLERANSHEQPLLSTTAKSTRRSRRSGKRRSRKLWAIIGGALLILILVGGLIAYLSLPHTDLSIASSRSGVHAILPKYEPATYHLVTPIKYASGTLSLTYRQTNGSKQYTIVEQNSNWDSQTLLDSFVQTTDPNYQTQTKDSQTFFLYNQNDLTWVNGGIWYQITGNSSLSQSQLLNIATSI